MKMNSYFVVNTYSSLEKNKKKKREQKREEQIAIGAETVPNGDMDLPWDGL